MKPMMERKAARHHAGFLPLAWVQYQRPMSSPIVPVMRYIGLCGDCGWASSVTAPMACNASPEMLKIRARSSYLLVMFLGMCVADMRIGRRLTRTGFIL